MYFGENPDISSDQGLLVESTSLPARPVCADPDAILRLTIQPDVNGRIQS